MARKKRTKTRTVSSRRRPSYRVKTRRSRKNSNKNTLMTLIAGSMLYGAVREKASNALLPVTARIPAGEFSDEVGLGVLSYLLAKRKIPFLKNISVMQQVGRAGLTIESARVGQFLSTKFMGNNMVKSSNSSTIR